MKNKLISAGIIMLATNIVLACGVYAAGQNNGNGVEMNTQSQQQTQTANQGDDTQIQNNEQSQNEIKNQEQNNSLEQESQNEDSQEKVQNKNQEQEQEEVKTQNKSETSAIAEQRRSEVANAVQEMLQLADRNGGLGEQIRTIAQSQNQNQEQLETSLETIQNRSGFARFIVGLNYGEINKAEKLLEQNREQIQQLNELRNQLANQSEQTTLTEQIQALEQANTDIENILNGYQNKFSLLGWIFKIFAK